jgi:hypothetical protein
LIPLLRSTPSALERATEFTIAEDLQEDTPMNGFDPIFSGVSQSDIMSSTVNTVPSPAFLTTTAIRDVSSKDHDWLFEMCKYFRNLNSITITLQANRHSDDSEFCVLPLTSDTAINPFRCKPQTLHGSRLLFHAVLALCYRHLNSMTSNWSEEMTKHRGKAAQLLETALANIKSRDCLQLLEPILILFTLDVSVNGAFGHSQILCLPRY